MNRSDIRSLVGKLCEDPNLTRFTSASYNDAIEKSQGQFAMDSKALFKDYAITMVAGTAAYSLPTDFMLEREVVLNGIELQPISRASLQRIKVSERWDDDEGTPQYYIVDPEEARKTITLYPKPSGTDAGTDLQLSYYAFPATLSSDGAIPLNSSALLVQFHMALAYYAAWLMLMYLPQTAEIAQKRSDLFASYKAKVDEAIQMFGTTKSEPLSFHPDSVRSR